MLEILLLSLIGLAAAQQPTPSPTPAVPRQFVPVCDFSQSTGSPVPGLPDQFSFTIEGNLIERNSTAIMTEYYDGPGNRGRLEFGFNASSGISIFDYNVGEIFLIPDFRTGDDCRASPIADSRFVNFTFGIQNINGSIHIGSPSMFVEALRDDSITQYVGEDMVRGIPTQRWQACVNRENISYLIDYYFVTEPWDYEGQGQKLDSTQMVPVQFTLNTTRISNGTIRNIYHIYTVVDFRAGPESVPDSLFRVPNGLACTGRSPGQPVPQIPQFFSAYTERVSMTRGVNSIQTSKEVYDIQNNLFRIDFYNSGRGRGRDLGPPGPVSIIHDFDTATQYFIGTQILNCTATPLSVSAPYFFDVTTDNSGTLQLVSPNNFFFLGNEFNYSYEGVSNVRGVDVDSWVSVRDFEKVAQAVNLTDTIYEVFFTRPGWIYVTDRSINTDPVPWRVKLSGRVSFLNSTTNSTVNINGTFQLDYFDFSTSEPNYDSFDISLCSAPEDYHTVLMMIPGQEKGLDFGRLRRNIRTSVSKFTGVKPLQIGNIQIIRENGTHVYVTFQISNLTEVALANTPNYVDSQVAVQLLTNNTNSTSTLPFKIEIAENVSVFPLLREVGRGRRNFNASCDNTNTTNNGTNKCQDNITNRLGLTDGVVAGIAVGLFAAGLLLGLFVMLVCMCCVCCWRSSGTYDIQRTKPVRYERQKDEITT